MNLKNMTYKEITQLVSTLNTSGDLEEAMHKMDDLIESLKILRSMLEGRKVLQVQKDQQKRRRGLKVVKKKNSDNFARTINQTTPTKKELKEYPTTPQQDVSSEANVLGALSQFTCPSFMGRKWGNLGMRWHSQEIDSMPQCYSCWTGKFE